MSRPKIIFTPAYEESLRGIEDFIYRSSQDLVALEAFADEHDRVLTFISENPTRPWQDSESLQRAHPRGVNQPENLIMSMTSKCWRTGCWFRLDAATWPSASDESYVFRRR